MLFNEIKILKGGKMKKIFILTSLLVAASAYGASIDHIQTYSPDYLSNQSQTGMINNVSSYYNPAGLGRLEKGKYIHTGVQYAFGDEKMSYNGKEHKARLRQAIPNLSLYSVDEKGAYFLTFGALGGGGKLKYKGVSGLDVAMETISKNVPPAYAGYGVTNLGIYDKGTEVKGSNQYEQLTLGRAFNVDDKLSFSFAARLVHGARDLAGDLRVGLKPTAPAAVLAGLAASGFPSTLEGRLDSKREAWGYGFQLGVNYKVNEKLNLAARYDSRIKLDFKSKADETQLQTKDLIGQNIGFSSFYPQYGPGTKIRRDLPAILALGASYKVNEKYIVSASGNLYFNRQAKMDRVVDQFGQSHGTSYRNGWELALGNEYKLNDKFTLIGSINYAKTGAKASSYNDTEFAIDSTTLGAGLRYKYDETLDLTASVAHFIYKTSEGTFRERHKVAENQKYSKSITAVGLSITKKF